VVYQTGRGEPADDRPGDAPCWLKRVCPRCGSIADEDPPTVCPSCQTAITGD